MQPPFFHFLDNQANLQGQDIFAFSLLQCVQSTLVPNKPDPQGCVYQIARVVNTTEDLFQGRILVDYTHTYINYGGEHESEALSSFL